ncbi:MAG: translocation/assembly module TamB domain-containing protein [Nitrospirae bacterium]|nr:translocation/assembly module TamB domain-containing protein [Nitrospirota bacterium]
MERTKKLRRIVTLSVIALFVGISLFVLRGPHISNMLKKVILPELEMASGKKVIAQKIYVNLFPLFVEAKGLKIFDDDGERILLTQRVKAYLDLTGIFTRRIVIRRLVVREPIVTAGRSQVEEIVANVEKYAALIRPDAIKADIKAVEIQDGSGLLAEADQGTEAELKGVDGEIIIGDAQRLRISAKNLQVRKKGWPEIKTAVSLNLLVKGATVEVKKVEFNSFGSRLAGTGELAGEKGFLDTRLELLVMTIKNMFSLSESGEGKIQASGLIQLIKKDISVDLRLDGKFYIETLMELLGVKEKIRGLIDVRGAVKGPLNALRADGKAVLRKGNLFDVDVDSLSCNVSYADGLMRFREGDGSLYNGTAKVSASIELPVVNHYTVAVDFRNIDSLPVFKLIGWDPGIMPGKVIGTLSTTGAEFNPAGTFEYRSSEKGRDVLGRIQEITGKYAMQGSVIALAGMRLSTGQSQLAAEGSVDIEKELLDFRGTLKTADLTDVTSPYYSKVKGSGGFNGRITGSIDNPVIEGKVELLKPSFENYAVNDMTADVTYRKELLQIRDMTARGEGTTIKLSGGVSFRGSRDLFDLAGPEYKLSAYVKNASLEKFVRIFYPQFTGTGSLSSEMKVAGNNSNPKISGKASIADARVYYVPFDLATFAWSYADDRLLFEQIKIVRGRSSASADASLDPKGNFSYKASAERIYLSDIVKRDIKGDAIFSVKSEGRGSFDNPLISLNARMIEGSLKGKPVGSGMISASIKEKDIAVRAQLINERIQMTARGRLEKDMPWDAKIDIHSGRYDSIISAFLKDVPEDLILNLSGTALLHGDKNHVYATSSIKQLTLSMYGYSFTNDREIIFELKDRHLALEKISLRSGATSLHIDGSLVLGKEYNLVLEGSSALSPFKSLSTKISLLRGDADLVLAFSGDWENPRINGGVTVTNGSFGLKDYAYRVGSVNGYLYLDNDRIVLQKLSGKLSGGDVEITGIVYLKKFSPKRFYVEAVLDNITVSPSNDFTVNFGGNILYKGTPASQIISGDIGINRARYRERVEWKSWLLKTRKAEKYKADISNLEKAELNIRITGRDNIHIDNNVARAEVSADMILRGSLYRPVLLGRLETREGTVYFRNNEFRILHASADFSDPNRINPIIDIASETSVKGYKIKMNLEGQLDHFAMSLSSDPVLKEMDILALLTVGQTGSQLKGIEGGVGAGEATSFVTGKLQDVLEERLRTITGLDRFQVDPHVSKRTGTVEPRVTVSKRLLGEKMFITYTSAVGSAEEQIIRLEYFLGKNVSLVGVRDERGILGSDIRFRFEFR